MGEEELKEELKEDNQNGALTRWRLILGQEAEEALPGYGQGSGRTLSEEELIMDAALAAIYNETGAGKAEGSAAAASKGRGAGSGHAAINLSKWLGDVRNFSRRMWSRSFRPMRWSVRAGSSCSLSRSCWRQ